MVNAIDFVNRDGIIIALTDITIMLSAQSIMGIWRNGISPYEVPLIKVRARGVVQNQTKKLIELIGDVERSKDLHFANYVVKNAVLRGIQLSTAIKIQQRVVIPHVALVYENKDSNLYENEFVERDNVIYAYSDIFYDTKLGPREYYEPDEIYVIARGLEEWELNQLGERKRLLVTSDWEERDFAMRNARIDSLKTIAVREEEGLSREPENKVVKYDVMVRYESTAESVR